MYEYLDMHCSATSTSVPSATKEYRKENPSLKHNYDELLLSAVTPKETKVINSLIT